MQKYVLGFFLCVFCLTGCATIQDKIALESRIASLERNRNQAERDIKQLKTGLDQVGITRDSKDQDFAGQYASLRAEIRKLQEEVRMLNGRLDETEFVMGQLNAQKGELTAKLEELSIENKKAAKQISELEQFLGTGAMPPKRIQPAASVPPKENKDDETTFGAENELYSQAKQAFDNGDFGAARTEFQKFISLYPNSKNADNAQFWIGETYYREAWYEKAILEYEEVKKKFPKGNKIPSTLLKQGMAFQQLDETANARLILEELVGRFPNSNEAAIAQKILKNL